MKVFFCSSPRAKVNNKEKINKIYQLLLKFGLEHSCDFIKDVDVEKFYSKDQDFVKECYKEMFEGIRKADIAVFESSIDSLAIGYLVNLALEQGKPVIILHPKNYLPYLFENIQGQHEKLYVIPYEEFSLSENLKGALELAKDQMDVRFNFFISPRIGAYLDWMSKTKKTPRAVYLRKLIEEDMEKSDYEPKEIKNKKMRRKNAK